MDSEPLAVEPANNDALEQTTTGLHTSTVEQVGHVTPLDPTVQVPTPELALGADEFANGYHFPPKLPLLERIPIGLLKFWDFYNTGFGLLFTVYVLAILGWGFMLFLLLVGAAPQMCWNGGKYNCDDIESPRRVWIEIDSQVLTALFSATAFGLAPWRLRDLFFLLQFRILKDQLALRRLAGVYRGWLRLEGSDLLPPTLGPKSITEDITLLDTVPVDSLPYPPEMIPEPPPTGIRAPPTTLWRMDFIAWFNLGYIIFQTILSSIMWGMSRYNRPSWATALLFGLTIVSSSAASIMEFKQVSVVKAIEGVPLTKKDIERLARDKELGIPHYNNPKDKDPEKMAKKKGRFSLRRNDEPVPHCCLTPSP